MNECRESLVDPTFRRLDTDLSGMVPWSKLFSVYSRNVGHHPLVRAGVRTQDQVLRDFVHMFSLSSALRSRHVY